MEMLFGGDGWNWCFHKGYAQSGRILLSVQVTSMLPWGHPEPPEMTLVILKDVGAMGVESGTGLASEVAAKARVASVYFIVQQRYIQL